MLQQSGYNNVAAARQFQTQRQRSINSPVTQTLRQNSFSETFTEPPSPTAQNSYGPNMFNNQQMRMGRQQSIPNATQHLPGKYKLFIHGLWVFFYIFFPFFASFFGNNFCSKHSFPLNKYRVCNLVNPFLRSFLFPTLNDMKTFCLMPNSIKVFNNTNWKVHRNAKFTNKKLDRNQFI